LLFFLFLYCIVLLEELVCFRFVLFESRLIPTMFLILGWVISQKEVGWGGMDWIDMAQDRDRWQAPVNAVMNL
jgi:hypothetical protein